MTDQTPVTEASPARLALRQLLYEAAVVGNSQQRLPAELRHRFDAACDAIEAEARAEGYAEAASDVAEANLAAGDEARRANRAEDALRDIEAEAAHLHAGGGMTKQQRASIERWAAVHIRQARADERERLAEAVRALPSPKRYENDANGNWFTTDMEYGWDCGTDAVLALLQPDTASES